MILIAGNQADLIIGTPTKCGTRTLERVYTDTLRGPLPDCARLMPRHRATPPCETAFRPQPDGRKQIRIMITRNPYHRAVSMWAYLGKRRENHFRSDLFFDCTFGQFADRLMDTRQHWIANGRQVRARGVDWIRNLTEFGVVFEPHLIADTAHLDALIRVAIPRRGGPSRDPRVRVPHINRTQHPHAEQMFTPAILQRLSRWIDPDLSSFGFPRLVVRKSGHRYEPSGFTVNRVMELQRRGVCPVGTLAVV